MLTFIDETDAINEAKDARMEQRTKPHVKERIKIAAALLGVDETSFVVSAAYRQAQAVIDDHARTKLTHADTKLIMAALDDPPPATAELKNILDMHEESVVAK